MPLDDSARNEPLKLLSNNMSIRISGEELVRVFLEIDLALISLHRIGAYYGAADQMNQGDYEHETTRFIVNWRVTDRLANARRIISEHFDRTLGEDDMGDLERAAETQNYWRNPLTQPDTRLR